MFAFACLFFILASFALSIFGFNQTFGIAKDVSILLLSFMAYDSVPFRDHNSKFVASLTFLVCCLLLAGEWSGQWFDFIYVLTLCLCVYALHKIRKAHDNIISEPLVKDDFYHVYGMPRFNLGMISFYLSLGRYGDHFITNGIHIWKFSRDTKRFEKVEFEEKYLNNKKLVKIEKDVSHILESKVGRKWSILNNCVTILFDFKFKRNFKR